MKKKEKRKQRKSRKLFIKGKEKKKENTFICESWESCRGHHVHYCVAL